MISRRIPKVISDTHFEPAHANPSSQDIHCRNNTSCIMRSLKKKKKLWITQTLVVQCRLMRWLRREKTSIRLWERVCPRELSECVNYLTMSCHVGITSSFRAGCQFWVSKNGEEWFIAEFLNESFDLQDGRYSCEIAPKPTQKNILLSTSFDVLCAICSFAK